MAFESGTNGAQGGGIQNLLGALTITGSTFSGNQAIGGDRGTGEFAGEAQGGAIKNFNTVGVSISGSTFEHN